MRRRDRCPSAWPTAWLLGLASCGRIGFADSVGNEAGGEAGLDGVPPAPLALTLDRIAPGEVLTDFPLPVLLGAHVDPALFGDGSRVRFLTSAGATLASEIEPGDPLVAWVRVPQIAGLETTLQLVFDGRASSPDPVWSDDFEAVYHLAAGARDATGHHDGVVSNGADAVGFLGGARAFDGASSIEVPDAPGLGFTSLTVEAWDDYVAPYFGSYTAMASRELGTSVDDELYFGFMDTAIDGVMQTSSGGAGFLGGTVVRDGWHHLAISYAPGDYHLYLDGALVARVMSGATPTHSANPIFIGANCNDTTGDTTLADTDFFTGRIDELRFHRVARSQAWLAYDIAAARDQVIRFGP